MRYSLSDLVVKLVIAFEEMNRGVPKQVLKPHEEI